MAAGMNCKSDQLGDFLRTYMKAFWLEHSSLSPAEIQSLWKEEASRSLKILSSGAPEPQVRLNKSSSQDTRRASHQFRKPAPQAQMMARHRTDQPASHPLVRCQSGNQSGYRRKRANSSGSGASVRPDPKHISPITTNYSLGSGFVFDSTMPPSPAKKQCIEATRRPGSLNYIPEVIEYSPEDYVVLVDNESPTNAKPIPPPKNPQFGGSGMLHSPALSISPVSSFESSQPSTPFQPSFKQPRQYSQGMSRHSSLGGSFCGGFNNMQLSHAGENSAPDLAAQIPTGDSRNDFSSHNAHSTNIFIDTALPIYTDNTVNDVSFDVTTQIASMSQSSLKGNSFEDDSISRHISSNDGTTNQSHSRLIRRRQEQLAQSERKLAPKISEEEAARARTGHLQRVKSASGAEKCAIAKSIYIRPKREKVKCDLCDEQFRGEHELSRHTKRLHNTVRKAWVCVDASENKKFLANCKACRNGKLYGAYYNAAAHLRRVHFNPKPKGRRARGSGKSGRAGSGGGDEPPMEYLKKEWIREVDEVVDIKGLGEDQAEEEDYESEVEEIGDNATDAVVEYEDGGAANSAILHIEEPQDILPIFNEIEYSSYQFAPTTSKHDSNTFPNVPRHAQNLLNLDDLGFEDYGIFNLEMPIGTELQGV